jgi:hypothetical protein
MYYELATQTNEREIAVIRTLLQHSKLISISHH